MDENLQLGAKLLFLLWRDVDPDFKSKYKLKIWDMYLSNVRVSSLQTHTLARFVEKLSSAMQVSTGRNSRVRRDVLDIISHPDAKNVLHAIRREPSIAIRYARDLNETLKQQFEEED